MIGAITAIAELGKAWVKGKAKVSEAKAEAEATALKTAAQSTADWERIMAEASKSSWKDEWLTILFSIPLLGAFIPSVTPYIHSGFEALEKMPEWYQYFISIIVAASFGVKGAVGIMGKLKGK